MTGLLLIAVGQKIDFCANFQPKSTHTLHTQHKFNISISIWCKAHIYYRWFVDSFHLWLYMQQFQATMSFFFIHFLASCRKPACLHASKTTLCDFVSQSKSFPHFILVWYIRFICLPSFTRRIQSTADFHSCRWVFLQLFVILDIFESTCFIPTITKPVKWNWISFDILRCSKRFQ